MVLHYKMCLEYLQGLFLLVFVEQQVDAEK